MPNKPLKWGKCDWGTVNINTYMWLVVTISDSKGTGDWRDKILFNLWVFRERDKCRSASRYVSGTGAGREEKVCSIASVFSTSRISKTGFHFNLFPPLPRPPSLLYCYERIYLEKIAFTSLKYHHHVRATTSPKHLLWTDYEYCLFFWDLSVPSPRIGFLSLTKEEDL